MAYWCFHDLQRTFTFTDGVLIEMCPVCPTFDGERHAVLRATKLEIPKSKQETHWNTLLDKAGLSLSAGDKPWLVYAGEVLSDKAIYKASHSQGDFEPVSDLGDILSILSTMTKRYPIEYTALDDNEHDLNAKRFPHSMNMPREKTNFCPKCSLYQTADHECDGDMVNEATTRRVQEEKRQLRDGSLRLSDPTELAPSNILRMKGGYGKHQST